MMRGRWRWIIATPGLGFALGCAAVDAQLGRPSSQARGQSPDTSGYNQRTLAQPAIASRPIAAPQVAAANGNVLPVTLDAVLQLAECQNPSLAVARERVNQAYAEQDLADKAWLPEVTIGAGYYRHEGGIQLQEGPLIRSSTGAALAGGDASLRLDLKAAVFTRLDAARRVKQQQGELKKLSTDVVLDAAGTYIDLLAAHSGIALARELESDLHTLRERAEKLAALERGARVEVVRIEGEISSQAQNVRKLEGQARAASAKLTYLLGLDSCTELVPADPTLVAFLLADADVPVCDLVSQALTSGPGVKELEGVLCIVSEGMSQANGPTRFLPVFTAQALEGNFWAGPGDQLDSANRFDLGVQARWNVTELCTADIRKRVASSLQNQAQLSYTDLRAKLTMGVQEARESILSGREQLKHAEDQMKQAKTALDLSEVRLREAIPGSTFSEVLLSRRAEAGARANYIGVLRDYDKAQLRLMILTGACRPPA